MFGPLTLILAVSGLAMLSAGAFAYFVLYGRIASADRVGQRFELIKARRHVVEEAKAARSVDPVMRRKSVQETLKEIEQRQKEKARRSSAPTLMRRIEQAGLAWSRRTFILISLACGLVSAAVAWFLGAPYWAVAVFGVVGVLGLPRWIVNFLRKRRMRKFLAEFANAVDVIVRGVKAGLPLIDCLKVIAQEAPVVHVAPAIAARHQRPSRPSRH